MKTKTIGELLKEERTAHRVQIEDMASRTRIRAEYLEALEENQFEKLPAATFVKGYIRAYSRLLGFDAAPLIALLRRDYKESAKGQLVPREFIKPVLRRRLGVTPALVTLAGVVLVFVVMMSYVVFQWYQLNKPPQLVVSAPVAEAFVAAQVDVEGRSSPEAVVSVNSQVVPVQADGRFHTQVYLPREGLSTITVEAVDRRGKSSLIQRTVYVRF